MNEVTFIDSRGWKRRSHGHSRGYKMNPTYVSWVHMRQRCYNTKLDRYQTYGARGITVCDRWVNSFENFLADMGERPKGKSIDRINNNGNYEPSNCRWATPSEQSKNQRKRAPKDMTGFRSGMLEVISYSHRNKAEACVWVVKCDCGNRVLRVGFKLKYSRPKSCGCLQNNAKGVIK